MIERKLPELLPRLIRAFVRLDADKEGAERGRPQEFRDWSWHACRWTTRPTTCSWRDRFGLWDEPQPQPG